MNNKEYFVNIKENNQVEIINIENIPIIPEIDIEKTGPEYAEKNEEIKYEFEIRNISNTDLDELTWIDYLPYEKTKITRIVTGTYNENINYSIYYKTNKNDYKFLKEVNSLNKEYIDLEILKLSENEIITEIKTEYGIVSKDFKNIDSPNIFVKINNNVKKGSEVINNTELIGIKDEYKTRDKDSTKTTINEKEITKKLPKTGC